MVKQARGVQGVAFHPLKPHFGLHGDCVVGYRVTPTEAHWWHRSAQ